MKANKLTSILILSLSLFIWTGCGETTPAAASTTEEASAEEKDPYITGGGISPYYKDPSAEADDSTQDTTADPDIVSKADALENKVQNIIASGESGADDRPAERVLHNIYVSTYGLDTNPGTEDEPVATIQQAIDMVSPGYTIYVMSGIYKGANTFNISGTESAPITITHAPGANASSVMISLAQGEMGAIFDLNNQSFIQLIDLRIGNSYTNWVYGVYMSAGCHNIHIEENEFINIDAPEIGGAYAILMLGDGATEETSIHDIYIYDNEVHNVVTGQGKAIAASGNVENITIDGNHVYSITNIGIDLYGGGRTSVNDALDQPRNCLVTGNEVHQCFGYNGQSCSGIFIDGARDTRVVDNYVYECPVGIDICSENYNYDYPTTRITVTGNTVHNNHDTGISVGGYNQNYAGVVHDSEISENIIYNNGYNANDGCNGEIHFEKCDGVMVADNIVRNHNYDYPVIGCGKTSEYVKNVSFVNNLYAYDKPEKIVFRFQGNEYIGLDAWNKFTGGSDKNTATTSGS